MADPVLNTEPFAMISMLTSRLSAKSSEIAQHQDTLSGLDNIDKELKSELQRKIAVLNFQIGIIKESLEFWKGVLEFFQKAFGKMFADLANPR